MEIAKVTTNDEFIKVVAHYHLLLSSPKTTKSSELKEIRLKIESFINKQIVKVNKSTAKDSSKLADLLSLLMLIDS